MPRYASPQMRLLVLVFTSATEHPTEPIDVIFRAREPCAARTLLTLDLGRNVDLRARLLLAWNRDEPTPRTPTGRHRPRRGQRARARQGLGAGLVGAGRGAALAALVRLRDPVGSAQQRELDRAVDREAERETEKAGER